MQTPLEAINPVYGKNKKDISKCHLLKILPSMQSIKDQINGLFLGDLCVLFTGNLH